MAIGIIEEVSAVKNLELCERGIPLILTDDFSCAEIGALLVLPRVKVGSLLFFQQRRFFV